LVLNLSLEQLSRAIPTSLLLSYGAYGVQELLKLLLSSCDVQEPS
jgi:hypothetical protein